MTTAFISYSWDPEPHPTWVRKLAEKLRADGVTSTLDQWHAVPGDNLPQFMERAIRENDHVIAVCTPLYKLKSDGRLGGVGYEGDIMSGEAFVLKNRRKFIPVLREGDWALAAPSWLLGSYYVDLRGADWAIKYSLLIDTLHTRLPEPPPVKAQGFRVLQDGTVLDTTTSLVWSNCRSTELVVYEEVNQAITSWGQRTGHSWRIPTEAEAKAVEEAEAFYPRPPIMIKVQGQHPFFGLLEKGPWTDQILRNVRSGDRNVQAVRSMNAGLLGAYASGYANSLGLNPYQVAQEAESVRRHFALRLVRNALEGDFVSIPDA